MQQGAGLNPPYSYEVIMKQVTVITPTIGSPKVLDAIESVKNQTYKCRHLVVIDGPQYFDKFVSLTKEPPDVHLTITPDSTGANGFYGHRIYAAYPHLLNSDYILFLDEDNWYEPDHVESLIKTIEAKNLDFSYSLRKIFSPKKDYLLDDNCESLGKWEIFMSRGSHHGKHYLIDTSSFCWKRDFIQKTCHYWHAGWGGDRQYLYSVKDHAKYDVSGKHSLCYRLDGNPNSVSHDFFITGNKAQEAYYGGKFPWLKT